MNAIVTLGNLWEQYCNNPPDAVMAYIYKINMNGRRFEEKERKEGRKKIGIRKLYEEEKKNEKERKKN